MTDLSTLRIGVDSREVRAATTDLNAMGRAADGAESATEGVGGAARRTGAALAEMQRFAAQANASLAATRQAEASLGAVGGGARLASHHVQNLAFQANDLVVQLASGANPMMAFVQQGSQIGGIMSQAGMGVGGFTKSLLGMIGIIKISSDAALDGAMAVSAAQVAQFRSATQAAMASQAAAETELVLATANAEVAGTGTAAAAAQTRLAQANARLSVANAEAAITAQVLAAAEAEAAVAATAAAAATTVALAPLAFIVAGVAAAVAGLYAAFKMFQSSVADTGEIQNYANSLGLTKKEMKELKDVHVTFGDTLSGIWKTISDGLGLGDMWNTFKGWAGDAFSAVLDFGMKAAAGIYAGLVGTFDAVRLVWKNLPAVLGDLFVQATNITISTVESLVNKVIDGINWVTTKANNVLKAMGMNAIFAEMGMVRLGRVANENAGAAANVTAQVFAAYNARYQEAITSMQRFGAVLRENIINATKARLAAQAAELIGKRNDGAGRTGKSDEQREMEQRIKAAEDFIASLEKQAATMGMTAIQLKEYEIAQAAAAAPTEALRDAILSLGAAVVEGMKAENVRQFTTNVIEALEFENSLLGMNARARAVATAEREMEKQQIERGSEAWNRYLAAVNAAQDGVTQYYDAFMGMQADIDLAGVFGDAGKAAAGLLNVFDQMIERQEAYAKAVEEAQGNATKLQAIEAKQARLQLNNYANLIGGVKGFFKEGTKGYKALQAAEMAFRAVELALAIKAAAVKLGLIGTVTTAKVTSDATMAASDTGRSLVEMANSAKTTVVKGVEAVINAIRSMPFPLNIAAGAATAAVVASLGVAIGGMFGGGNKREATNTGTGTVFGDSSKQSESIQRSLELLGSVNTLTMRYSAQMAASLRSIESNIGGLTNLILRVNGAEAAAASVQTGTKVTGALGVLTKTMNGFSDFLGSKGGKVFGAAVGFALAGPVGALLGPIVASVLGSVGKVIGGIVKALFGTKTKVVGQGIYGGAQSLGDILGGGFEGQYFTDIKKTKKFFGISTGSSYSTQFSPADEELNRQFGLIFKGFYDAISAATGPLGLSLNDVQSRLNSFVVNIGKIDLKGLTGEQIQEKLNAVFGAAADSMAKAAIPGLVEFQKVGEGYFETVVRVASGIEQAGALLRKIGVEAIAYTEILNKQGDVAAEIIRQSVVLNDASAGVAGGFAEIVQNANGTAEELIDLVLQLRQLQDMLVATGKAAIDLTTYMILGAGGAEELAAGLQSFVENVLTDSARMNLMLAQMAAEFGAIGQAMPTTLQGFADLVASIDTTTEAGQQLYGAVIALTPSFVAMIDSITQARDDAIAAEQQAISDLQKAVSGLNEDVAKAEAALAAAVKREQEAAKSVLKTQIDALKEQAKTLGDSVRQFETLGDALRAFSKDIIPLSGNGAGSIEALRRQFADLANRAQLGDVQAMADLPAVGKDLRDATIATATDRTSMMLALYAIKAQTDAAIGTADRQRDIAQEQLDALNTQIEATQAQIDAIGATTEAVLTVAQAQAALDAATAARDAVMRDITAAGFASLIAVGEQTNAQLAALAIAAIQQAQADQAAIDAAQADAVAAAQQAAADAAAAAAAAAAQAAADAAAAAAAAAAVPAGYAEWLAQLQTYNPALQDTQALRDAYANLQAYSLSNMMGFANIPLFADGGDFGGGLRIVGERGPELQATGPARIYDANKTASMMQGGATAEEVKGLRAELRSAMFTIAKNTGKTADQLNRWDGDGLPETRTVAA